MVDFEKEAEKPRFKYIEAQHKVLRIQRKVDKLAVAGNHKSKNKTINDELRKATTTRNQAAKAVIDELNIIAEYQELVEHRFKDKK